MKLCQQIELSRVETRHPDDNSCMLPKLHSSRTEGKGREREKTTRGGRGGGGGGGGKKKRGGGGGGGGVEDLRAVA